MVIREATENDISEILLVLKRSLGETSSKKTEEVWRYKHVENPFGKSFVLVATEKDRIIGVRAFMRWNWQRGEKVFKTFRAVDTATDPDHQGKGIFKKLTLKALEMVKEEGGHFIFNTPNTQSKPGYLKMGWQEVGKLKVTIKPTLNFQSGNAEFKHHTNHSGLLANTVEYISDRNIESNEYFTPKSIEYLNWRYKKCKLQNYWIYEDEDYYLAAYPKSRNRFTELRISEAIWKSSSDRKVLQKHIKQLAKEVGANFISDSTGVLNFGIQRNFGPDFTLRNLNVDKTDISRLFILNNWRYSLGDLELF